MRLNCAAQASVAVRRANLRVQRVGAAQTGWRVCVGANARHRAPLNIFAGKTYSLRYVTSGCFPWIKFSSCNHQGHSTMHSITPTRVHARSSSEGSWSHVTSNEILDEFVKSNAMLVRVTTPTPPVCLCIVCRVATYARPDPNSIASLVPCRQVVHGDALDGVAEGRREGLQRLSRVVRVWARHTASHKTEVIRALQSVRRGCVDACATRVDGWRFSYGFGE